MTRINKINKKHLIYLVAIFLIINLGLLIYFLVVPASKPVESENLKVIFLDIGQGDATLIKTPEGKNILIDGGPDKSIIYKLDQYIPFYKRKIDLMILTHPDPDHLNGLVEVLKRYLVGKVFYNGVKDEDPTYSAFLELIEEKKIKKEILWQGKTFILENGQTEVIFPLENLTDKSFKNDNEASLVFKFTIGKTKILLTGDATKGVEEKLITKGANLKADILKVAHHGSKDSTTQEFLSEVQPTYGVISVGKNNKFGHPTLRVLKNLEKIGAQILRTDQLGDIIFEIKSDTNILMHTNNTNN